MRKERKSPLVPIIFFKNLNVGYGKYNLTPQSPDVFDYINCHRD